MHDDTVPRHVQLEYRRARWGWIESRNHVGASVYIGGIFSKLGCGEGGCGVDDKVARFCDVCAGDSALEVGPAKSSAANIAVEASYEAVESNGGGGDWVPWPSCNEAVGGVSRLM